MSNILLIDDDPAVHIAFRRALEASQVGVESALTPEQAISRLGSVSGEEFPDALVVDVHLPQMDGIQLLGRIRQLNPHIPVLVVSGAGSTESMIEASKLGAIDFLCKPFDLAQLRAAVMRAVSLSNAKGELGHAPPSPAKTAPVAPEAMVGRSPAIREVYKAIGRVAPRDVTVLLLGETGTGKELVARAVHEHSSRSSGPMVAINCAAIPDTLLESELFGHERGAFTGADAKRIGRFEQAAGGTLFLDEIGDMSPATQAKVLRVLQSQEFARVGGNQTIRSDARIIAATHRDLYDLVQQGRFRADLYYRLSVFTIRLPSLRERSDDLPLLVEHFLQRLRRELQKDEVQSCAPETIEELRRRPMPGNIRQLQSILKQALLNCHGRSLTPDCLPPVDTIRNTAASPWQEFSSETETGRTTSAEDKVPVVECSHFVEHHLSLGSRNLYDQLITAMERELLVRVLHHTGGNQVHAAKILGITRGSLRTKIRSHGLAIDRSLRTL